MSCDCCSGILLFVYICYVLLCTPFMIKSYYANCEMLVFTVSYLLACVMLIIKSFTFNIVCSLRIVCVYGADCVSITV